MHARPSNGRGSLRDGAQDGHGVHRCRPQAGSDARVVARHESRESPSKASNAWSVGPRPTPDEAGERMHAQPSNGRGSLRDGAQDGQWRSSLPAAGRHSMRGSWFGTNRANRRRTHPAHGASARGRRLTRPASACMPSRRTAGARFALGRRTANGVHRCRPQAGTPCAGRGSGRIARIAVERIQRMERPPAADA
jgi:hypothetical protein